MENVKRQHIKSGVERELWARAAGRCQFSACNEILYRSSVTQEAVHRSQKAHIWSVSKDGPRGQGPYADDDADINEIGNLMLVCHGCHTKIDQDKKGDKYSADLLQRWKHEHEQRIEIVTGIHPDKKSHLIFYGANIGSEKSPIGYNACVQAMFPAWYPARERPITVSMAWELTDSSREFWQAERRHLLKVYEAQIEPVIKEDECKHFSIFALAPQPLLIYLGALLTDKIDVETYQPHREPKGWYWAEGPDDFAYVINSPADFGGEPVLLLSLSDHVARDRVHRILGDRVSIWELTVDSPHNDFLQAKEQLSQFRKAIRRLMVEIKHNHGNQTPLHIFPVMPVACAIELGRARMPKAEMPWIIYDHNIKEKEFTQSIVIEGDSHAEPK
ncbi:SAVED domain-containing protein [Haliea atlantica]